MGRISASRSNGEGDGDSISKWPVYGKRLNTKRQKRTAFSPSTSTSAPRATTSAAPEPQTSQRQEDEPISVDESTEDSSEEETDSTSEDSTREETDKSDKDEECKRDVSVILSDLEILDCPICLEPLKLPVFQCKNGHIACESCCKKMKNKCGNCSLHIGHIRCRVIETVIESVKIACRYAPHGCPQKLLYKEKLEHEKACEHIPYWCPRFECSFVGKFSDFIKHIEVVHSFSCKQFTFGSKISLKLYTRTKQQIILRESSESSQDVIFVLNHSNEPLGSLVEVVCTGRTSDEERYDFLLTSSNGGHSIKMESEVDYLRKLTATTRLANFLLVPKKFVGPTGHMELEVTISRREG